MSELPENATREQVKQYITDEIANVRKTINAEMENIRNKDGSIDYNKIYFFDNDGKEIPAPETLSGIFKPYTGTAFTIEKQANLLAKNIPIGTVKIVTAGSLIADSIPDTISMVVSGGNMDIDSQRKAKLISGGDLTADSLYSEASALGTINVKTIRPYNRIENRSGGKIIAGTDIKFTEIYDGSKVISGHNIIQTGTTYNAIGGCGEKDKVNTFILAANNFYSYSAINQARVSAEKDMSCSYQDYNNAVKDVLNNPRTPSSDVSEPMVLRSNRKLMNTPEHNTK